MPTLFPCSPWADAEEGVIYCSLAGAYLPGLNSPLLPDIICNQ